MGNSVSLPGFTKEILEDYVTLTYLSKYEIISLLKIIYNVGKREMDQNFYYRFPCGQIEQIFPNLKCNPFRDRLYEIFSSQKDNCFSFEDILDLCSVMSHNCPEKVKAKWALKIFDFDNDDAVGEKDIIIAIDRLINYNSNINNAEKKHIARTLLDSINFQKTGAITALEFEHAMSKMPEFAQIFSFTI